MLEDPRDAALPEYARDLLEQVLSRTSCPLLCRTQRDLVHDSEVRPARGQAKHHELLYRPEYEAFRLHFVINAARKVIRYFETPAYDRYLPATPADRGLPGDQLRELREKNPRLSPLELQALGGFLYQGLIRQLTSFPVDLRVEREIHELLPEHRALQRSYLERQVQDLIPHFILPIEQMFPYQVCRASSAMNIVLATEAASIAGVDVPDVFVGSRYHQFGERLALPLRHAGPPGLRNDRFAIDAWADELGILDWYEWVRADSM